jgi:hypothetical protein
MAIDVSVDPIALDTTVLGSWRNAIYDGGVFETSATLYGSMAVGAVLSTDALIEIEVSHKMAILSHYPPADRNPALDSVIFLGYPSLYSGDLEVEVLGTWLNRYISADPITVTTNIPSDTDIILGLLLSVDAIEVSTFIYPADMVTEAIGTNILRWSKIGSLDFEIDHSNVAGMRRTEFSGWIYSIKKLSTKIVVYGQNGIALLLPNEVYFGYQNIHPKGLKGKATVCGSELKHFFIDSNNELYAMDEGLTFIGYKEYFETLGDNAIMSYDTLNDLIYICDGISGYVFNVKSNSLGEGPKNITGVGHINGDLIVGSYGDITTPAFNICTDIYDFGSRKNKNINQIEIGTDLNTGLYAAIDYRKDKSEEFKTTAWRLINPAGVVTLPCFGVEFRFRFKTLTYEQFSIDYIKILGQVHNYSYMDSM